MSELYLQFVIEANEHLESIVNDLVQLGDSEPPYELAGVLRSAHSLKGAARMVGAASIASLADELETALGVLVAATDPDQEAIDAALVHCDRMMQAIEQAGDETADLSEEEPVDDGDFLGDEAQEPALASVRAALPTLPEDVIEGLTEFQIDSMLRLVSEKSSFWLVHVDTNADSFEQDSDSVADLLRQQGEIISQTATVNPREGYDYLATFIFAASQAPSFGDDVSAPVRSEELPREDIQLAERPQYERAESSESADEGDTSSAQTESTDGEGASGSSDELMNEQLQEIFLASADNLVQELTDTIASAERSPDSTDVLDALFRSGHSLKGAGASFGFPIISRLGREMETVLDRVRRRQLELSDSLISVLYECVDALSDIIGQAQSGTLDQDEALPVIDRLKEVASGRAPTGEGSDSQPEASIPSIPTASSLGHTIHLSVDAADHMLDLGRDAWLAAEPAAFVSPPEGAQRDAVDRTRSAILSLVDAILSTRMQAVGQILKAYPRLVRDVCRRQKKRIRLDIVGADVQMDRLLLEAMNDPLVHLVRNALDHGLETIEERERAGKPPEGVLTIHAQADRDTVTIEVRDDGRGVDTRRLREKAVAMGRLTQDAADGLSEEQAIELMFLPALSTRNSVTELSGRGVGMDVVRSNIEQLRGRVEVSSSRGRGTTIRLILPLTTAMLRVVEVEVAGVTMCLPTTAVDRVISLQTNQDEVELESPDGNPEIVPLVPASRFLPNAPEGNGAHEAILLRDRGQVLGLVVDRVIDERPVLITDLGGLIPRTHWVGACTLLANGQVAPILDTNAIIETVSNIARPGGKPVQTVDAAPSTTSSGLPTILAVDDSPTMRQLLRNVLELAGYHVELAENGRAALDAVSKSMPSLVLTDMNMPIMDGIDLVREIRRQWSDLPVAIVSGRDQESDRQAGLAAGANAYIVKGAADRRGLLSTVSRLLGRDQ